MEGQTLNHVASKGLTPSARAARRPVPLEGLTLNHDAPEGQTLNPAAPKGQTLKQCPPPPTT